MTPKALVRNRCAHLSLTALVVPGTTLAKDEESKKLWKHGFLEVNAGCNSDQGIELLWKTWTERAAVVGSSRRFDYLFNKARNIVGRKFIIQTGSPEAPEFKKCEVNFNPNHQ